MDQVPPPPWKAEAGPAGLYLVFRNRVWLADFIEAESAVATLDIGSRIAQMSGTDIFQAVGLGTAMLAFETRVIGKTPYLVFQPLQFQGAHMH
jgi:hypothetical protein